MCHTNPLSISATQSICTVDGGEGVGGSGRWWVGRYGLQAVSGREGVVGDDMEGAGGCGCWPSLSVLWQGNGEVVAGSARGLFWEAVVGGSWQQPWSPHHRGEWISILTSSSTGSLRVRLVPGQGWIGYVHPYL
uniref:Uncharacterized protein n=1 Tax=Oryza punctata TaxID=4537 RepID=A0A0E0KBB2_ORYPU